MLAKGVPVVPPTVIILWDHCTKYAIKVLIVYVVALAIVLTV